MCTANLAWLTPLRHKLVMRRKPTESSFLFISRRNFSGLFEEKRQGDQEKAVSAFAIRLNQLDRSKTILDRKLFGIPFHVSDAEALDNVCRHHGTSVEVHHVQRYMLPFWLMKTAVAGTFKADILQRDPAFMTQQHCFVWVEGPLYEFNYPFDECMTVNQISASYLEPMRVVESCITGSHIPSMLISRFELMKELEGMKQAPKIVSFTMSTTTALSVVEKRISRRMVLDRVDKELKKFHGSFLKSNVRLTSMFMEAVGVRPVFLPLMKLMVSTVSNHMPVPAFVCGATGKVVGPVLHVNSTTRLTTSCVATLSTLLTLAPLVEPGIATAAAIAAGILTMMAHRFIKTARFLREQSQGLAELRTLGILNLNSDVTGYRWTPEDEEKQEYEYREELRRRARRKEAFEQRVKEEAARDKARQQGKHFDARNRRRTDLEDIDPLGYYELLGLKGREFTATAKDISKAFRQAVRVHHPDVNAAHDTNSKKKHMQQIIEAYKILHNPKTKALYDRGELNKKDADES
ncbi:unnamed protein product [Phytomonas sp. EM1]|nr:unnamed protein product [Phytomonas sp. EM1]|eukprot:CCW64040.1 unnamed protein product [Phytomonas sp. isolate EM1]